ncbi:Major facilitator superfamily domain-containing protein 4A [Halotydeus destructor]|nr:Major facilitator superfamily domain-containing protein 4A [Halotydeus destructor]
MAETVTIRNWKTAALCCSYFAIGLVGSITGPTILELQCALSVSYVEIIKIIPTRAAGWAIGSLLAGMLYEHVDPLMALATSSTLMGMGAILIPRTNSLAALLTTACITSMAGGMIDNGSTILTLYIWGKESQFYMQALHFSYGLGALAAPLLSSQFLSTVNLSSKMEDGCDPENMSVGTPYAIIGAFCLWVAMLFLYLHCSHGQTDEHPTRLTQDADPVTGTNYSSWTKRVAILVAGMFLFTLLGLEIGMSNFITSFAVMSDHHFSKQVGAYMTSLYWVSYTFFRLFVIMVMTKISITVNIIAELSILVIANIFLVPFGNSVEWCLWLGTALAGIGLSTVWASTFSLLEVHFPVTSRVATFLDLSACLGEWALPIFMGYAIEAGPQSYLWMILLYTVLCCLLFALLSIALKATVSSTALDDKNLTSQENYGTMRDITCSKPLIKQLE